jgi:hypothetical protein
MLTTKQDIEGDVDSNQARKALFIEALDQMHGKIEIIEPSEPEVIFLEPGDPNYNPHATVADLSLLSEDIDPNKFNL